MLSVQTSFYNAARSRSFVALGGQTGTVLVYDAASMARRRRFISRSPAVNEPLIGDESAALIRRRVRRRCSMWRGSATRTCPSRGRR